jgi:hypothetical protein
LLGVWEAPHKGAVFWHPMDCTMWWRFYPSQLFPNASSIQPPLTWLSAAFHLGALCHDFIEGPQVDVAILERASYAASGQALLCRFFDMLFPAHFRVYPDPQHFQLRLWPYTVTVNSYGTRQVSAWVSPAP